MSQQPLLPEYDSLLEQLVEDERSTPRNQRHGYGFIQGIADPLGHIMGGRSRLRAPYSELLALANAGMLQIESYDQGKISRFSVAPRAVLYYEQMKLQHSDPTNRVSEEIRRYFDVQEFQSRHPSSHDAWLKAERLLWGDDYAKQFTAIGHHCREAMQHFATELVGRFKLADAPSNPQSTGARIRAVLEHQSASLGETERQFLNALLAYWGALIDLVQRQEHGATREQESLVWEDARRVVFQTAIVMFEIDRSLSGR